MRAVKYLVAVILLVFVLSIACGMSIREDIQKRRATQTPTIIPTQTMDPTEVFKSLNADVVTPTPELTPEDPPYFKWPVRTFTDEFVRSHLMGHNRIILIDGERYYLVEGEWIAGSYYITGPISETDQGFIIHKDQ